VPNSQFIVNDRSSELAFFGLRRRARFPGGTSGRLSCAHFEIAGEILDIDIVE
jgi:hypothetical protein